MLKRTKKGFTLVELMIVVAILGVLAAVAIPQYMNYVEASKARIAKSNFVSAVNMVSAEYSRLTADLTPAASIIEQLNDPDGKDNANPYAPKLADGTTNSAFAVAGTEIGVVILSVDTVVGFASADTIAIDLAYTEDGNAMTEARVMTYR